MGNKQTIFTEEQLDNYQVSRRPPSPAFRAACGLQTLPPPSAGSVTLGRDFEPQFPHPCVESAFQWGVLAGGLARLRPPCSGPQAGRDPLPSHLPQRPPWHGVGGSLNAS